MPLLLLPFAMAATLRAQDTLSVKKVISGTVFMATNGMKISLLGVGDPPTGAVTPRDAKDRLESLLKGKRIVAVADTMAAAPAGAPQPRYVWAGDVFVNQRLIDDGFATLTRGASFSMYNRLAAAEDRAKGNKIGAWRLLGIDMNTATISANPNPLTDVSLIEYQLPKASRVTVQVFEASGRAVATLVNEKQSAGRHTAIFQRLTLKSGEYTCRLTADGVTLDKKLTLIDK
jgi:endonuclease YncB( thermonuclease family)